MSADAVQEILLRLATIDSKIDSLIDSSRDHEGRLRDLERRPGTSEDAETRLRALEKARWVALGAATAMGGVAGAIGQLLQ